MKAKGEIYFTASILKDIKKLKLKKRSITIAAEKHLRGAKNLIHLFSPFDNTSILKGYLSDKKIRIAFLLKTQNRQYIPLYIGKKSSLLGRNLSKHSEKFLMKKFRKTTEQLEQKRFIVYHISA